MILLGLHGPKQSGKDAAFEVIQEWASERGVYAVRRGFADLLKLSAARCFFPDIGMDDALAWADAFKFRGRVDAAPATPRFTKGPDGEWLPENIPNVSITGRVLLQRYGTESHRDVFDDNFWVDQHLPKDELRRVRSICKFLPDTRLPQICCLTDVRFENEAERIHLCATQPAWFSEVWRIDRPELEQYDSHVSEKPLPRALLDRELVNDGTLEDWRIQVRANADEFLIPALEQYNREVHGQ